MKKSSNLSLVSKNSASSEALDFDVLNRITDRAFFLALQMIEIANHKRPVPDRGEPKVGGHPSACASSQHILAAIHLVLRNPEDYFANKPHVSPIDHAFNYLLHNFREKDGSEMSRDRAKIAMSHLRHYSKDEPVFQSYHAEADPDGYRYFPSGSVGIPPVNALYMSLAYQFAKDHGHHVGEDPTFWCLMGDSEFREGSLMEAMPDAGERQLGNLIWIVDYNRQNLDGTRIFNEKAFGGTDADRIVGVARANGWHSVKLKHGKLREKLFKKPGGEEFKKVLDEKLTDFEFQSLLGANDPAVTRKALGLKSAKLKEWLSDISDAELQKAFFNLGGHDLESLIEVFQEAKSIKDKPSLIVPYTIKGWGLRCQAMSGNHSALPETAELEEMAKTIGASASDPFAEFTKGTEESEYLEKRRESLVRGIDRVLEAAEDRKTTFVDFARKEVNWPADLEVTALKMSPLAHTQWMWGQIAAKLDRLARGIDVKIANPTEGEWRKVSNYFMTMAPDVGSSTNTSPNMNGKLYGDVGSEDFEKQYGTKDEKAPDVVPNISERTGHIRFEIAEGNCMSAAGSFGKFFYHTGIPFFPAMTIYDFFIKRAHDQFYYNLYWHSSFVTLGTPSGVTLAPEGAQHSWKSDFQIPYCVTWEPCFAKELEWIFADMLRRHFCMDNEDREGVLIRCVTKGVPQKELLGRAKTQKRFEGKKDEEILETLRQEVLQGAYALIDYRDYEDYTPGDNVVHIFAMGALGIEAIKASDELRKKGIFGNVYIVTSPDLLLGNFAYHDNYRYLKEHLGIDGKLNLTSSGKVASRGDWFAVQGARVPVVSVHDGEPGLLDNIGSIVGVKHHTLAVRKTSKSGTTPDIFKLHHLDAGSVVEACEEILKETAEERFEISRSLLSSLQE